MNRDTIIELTFNEKLERENQNFYFKYIWSKILKTWIKITVCAIIFLFLGFYPIKYFDRSFFYYFFKYGGIFLAGYSLILVNHYFSSKKKFKIEVNKLIGKFKTKNEPHFTIINDQYIEFKNPLITIKSTWENTSYVISGDYILISPVNNLNYIIHKSEVSNNEFQIIKEHIQKYSKQSK